MCNPVTTREAGENQVNISITKNSVPWRTRQFRLYSWISRNNIGDRFCSHVIDCLPSFFQAFSSIASTTRNQEHKRYYRQVILYHIHFLKILILRTAVCIPSSGSTFSLLHHIRQLCMISAYLIK